MFGFNTKTRLAMLAALSLFGCAHEHVPQTTLHPELAVVRIASARGGLNPGCGFLISAHGLLVTTRRLVSSGTPVNVTLSDGRTLSATFVEEDQDADVALLRIPGDSFPFLHLGNDDIEPVMHIRVVGPTGLSHGIFDRWENSGQAIGFTARVTAADSGAPLLADDGTVIGVVREPSPDAASAQLATPIWHVTRMVPIEAK